MFYLSMSPLLNCPFLFSACAEPCQRLPFLLSYYQKEPKWNHLQIQKGVHDMRPILLSLSALLLTGALASCSVKDPSSSSHSASPPETASTPEESSVWGQEELLALFQQGEEAEQYTVLDCVPMEDFSYQRVGAVLFIDENDPDMCYLAFLDADGAFQKVGLQNPPAEDSHLDYLGEGSVSFSLLDAESGEIYPCTVTFSKPSDDSVHFQVTGALVQTAPERTE